VQSSLDETFLALAGRCAHRGDSAAPQEAAPVEQHRWFLRRTGLWSADQVTSLRLHIEPACVHLPAPPSET